MLLIETHQTCISAGTERASVDNAGSGIAQSIVQRPELVGRALEMVREQGVAKVVETLRNRSQRWSETGYSAVGTVLDNGGLEAFRVGDRVACAGAEWAHHAEIITVPQRLAGKVDDAVSDLEASTTTIGAIALQGVRRANPTFGEKVLVIGLGLVGQLTVQILIASGVRVAGQDLRKERADLAIAGGAELASSGPLSESLAQLKDFAAQEGGYDAVIVTASTPSDEPVNIAFDLCRKRGRVVVVGDTGLALDRARMYAKELDLLISTSYGPGRYDKSYELHGQDYPLAYARWTLNRNMQAYLQQLAAKRITLNHLAPESFDIADAAEAFGTLQRPSPPVLVTLVYPPDEQKLASSIAPAAETRNTTAASTGVCAALIGPGAFASATTLPILNEIPEVQLKYVVGRNGSRTTATALRFASALASTNTGDVWSDPEVNAVFITTPHDQHGLQVREALAAGKHVFVEKPLALNAADLDHIDAFYAGRGSDRPILTVGYNRRFAPLIADIAALLQKRKGPLVIQYAMNVGPVAPDDWTQSPQGGGRNLGEACHIYDLFLYLTGSPFKTNQATAVTGTDAYRPDANFVATLAHEDGSLSSLSYNTAGSPAMEKERMELHFDGITCVLTNYTELQILKDGKRKRTKRKQDKGHRTLLQMHVEGLLSGQAPIPLSDAFSVSRVALEIQAQLRD